MAPPVTRVLAITPGFLKSFATAATGVVVVPEPASGSLDRNIPSIRFTNNDTKKHFLSVWKRVAGGGIITDDFLVFGKQYEVEPKSPIEIGPLNLANGWEIAAAIVDEPSAVANDDKINFEVDAWETTFS